MIISLVDPSPVPLRKPPRDAEAWVTAAAGSWVVALDNMTHIPDWLSDSLCRAVTGDGDVRRMLYANFELVVFSFRRCVVMSGIDLGALNGDLVDRLLPVHLDVIPPAQRREESALWERWGLAYPRILGALLTALSDLIRILPAVELDAPPRMADFAKVLAGVDRLYGTHGLELYIDKARSIATESLTADPFDHGDDGNPRRRFRGDLGPPAVDDRRAGQKAEGLAWHRPGRDAAPP